MRIEISSASETSLTKFADKYNLELVVKAVAGAGDQRWTAYLKGLVGLYAMAGTSRYLREGSGATAQEAVTQLCARISESTHLEWRSPDWGHTYQCVGMGVIIPVTVGKSISIPPTLVTNDIKLDL